MDYVKVGKITHYFDKIGVAVLQVSDESVKVGDKIRIGEFGTGIEQKIDSMQVEHQNIIEAKSGDEVGLKVISAVKSGDIVYKISE
jgi:selenocysteine-specific translation elongation factor